MDRLQPVAALALWLSLSLPLALASGCKDKPQSDAPPTRDRAEQIDVRPEDRRTPGEVCDQLPAAARAPAFTWPALAGDQPSSGQGRWRWVNVWATWCKPCVEEMPRITQWRDRLTSRGARIELVLLSADASQKEIDDFRLKHPGTPASLRIAEPDALPAWLEKLGMAGAALPVHILVDDQGRLRCGRASAVGESDYEAFETLVLGK